MLSCLGDKDGSFNDKGYCDEELLDKGDSKNDCPLWRRNINNYSTFTLHTRGYFFSNTPGVLTNATAELAFALILAISRRVVECDRIIREGRFQYWAPRLFLGHEVTGKTLGIIGLGKIGEAVARRAKGFDMRILYYNRGRLDISKEKELLAEYVSLKTLLMESDFVSLHVPLTEHTHHLIGREELSLMKPTAYLINTSRGPMVDECALVDALKKNIIGGAGLDVYENEFPDTGLTALDNVDFFSAMSKITVETRNQYGAMAMKPYHALMFSCLRPFNLRFFHIDDR